MREFDTEHDKLDVACLDGCKHCMSFESRCAYGADFAWGTITVCRGGGYDEFVVKTKLI